mmetsp:Transcript_15136/g.25924  ORF Transcript_15136/g.25924 Transcript_15136/m.25924 type:complete len:144 (-) Transcript_15136:462-893(-)
MGYDKFRGLLLDYPRIRCRKLREQNEPPSRGGPSTQAHFLRFSSTEQTVQEQRKTSDSTDIVTAEFEGIFSFEEDAGDQEENRSLDERHTRGSDFEFVSIHSSKIDVRILSLVRSDPINIPRRSCRALAAGDVDNLSSSWNVA